MLQWGPKWSLGMFRTHGFHGHMTSVHTGSEPLSHQFVHPPHRKVLRLQKWTPEHLSILECLGKVVWLSPFTDKKLRPRKMAHSNLVNRDEQDSLGILSPSQGTWGGPGCLLHLDWLTFFLFINLSFSLWKQLEFVFPGSPEKRVSVKILEEVAEGPDLSWTAWHSISRFTPRCLPLFFWKWFWLQMDLLRLKEVHSSL